MVRARDVEKPALLTVIGVPDDVFQADGTGVYVNEVALTGYSRELLTGSKWARQVVQMDHYLVIGEERVGDALTGYLGIQPAERIESAR